MTKGSLGNMISRGAISVLEALREEPPPKTAAIAFPRVGLKGELLPFVGPGEGSAEPGLDALCSEVVERVRLPIGTVRLLIFELPPVGEAGERGRGTSSSEGVSPGAGIGRPRAAAIICGSVQSSSKSFNPRQKGASLRSI